MYLHFVIHLERHNLDQLNKAWNLIQKSITEKKKESKGKDPCEVSSGGVTGVGRVERKGED